MLSLSFSEYMCFIICCSREASPSSSGHYGQMVGGRTTRKIAPLTADSLLKLCVSVVEDGLITKAMCKCSRGRTHY